MWISKKSLCSEIDEIGGARLCVTMIEARIAHKHRIIDGRVLVASDDANGAYLACAAEGEAMIRRLGWGFVGMVMEIRGDWSATRSRILDTALARRRKSIGKYRYNGKPFGCSASPPCTQVFASLADFCAVPASFRCRVSL